MHKFDRALFAVENTAPKFGRYSVRQRLLSASVSLTMTGSATATAALANTAMPVISPVIPASANHVVNHSAWQSAMHGATAAAAHTAALTAVHGVLPFALSNTLHGIIPAAASQGWHATSSLPNFVNAAGGSSDVNLTSATAMFAAGSLAGFHTITLDIGGKEQTITFKSQLTGAELVAAQQVLSGGKQELVINSNGVATGGLFDINSSSVAQIASAIPGGAIGGLDISHGVIAVDTLSNLALNGSLINYGTIDMGAAAGVKGQTDLITATNIYNANGAVISSATGVSGVSAANVSLNTPGIVYNSGTIHSSGDLSVAAASITNAGSASGTATGAAQLTATNNVNLTTANLTNTGLISAEKGNVNIGSTSAIGDLNIVGTGGTIQAQAGNINVSSNGTDNINLTGGNYLSQQLNLDAGSGSIEANVGQVTGVVAGTGSAAHVTADTANLDLGGLQITGDPTYYNQGGDITIGTSFAATSGQDLAIVASGNIIGNGGTLDTSSTNGNGGNLTLIAGAFFTTSSTTSNPANADLLITDNPNSPGKGSATGGYIDLSGTYLTGSRTNVPVVAVDTSSTTGTAGNILMVAYSGSDGSNPYAGSIIASGIPNSGSGPTAINATGATAAQGGVVTIIGGGNSQYAYILGQNINAATVSIMAGTPTLGSGNTLTINTSGTPSGATYTAPIPTYGLIEFFDITATAPTAGTGNTTINLSSANSIVVGSSVGLNASGGNVAINTSGLAEVYGNIITSGAGGAAGQAGGNAGSVNVSAYAIYISGAIDASGGGGGGGNAGQAGGVGGAGGNVNLTATGLAKDAVIEVGYPTSSTINVSGGGGGGGGGGGDAGAAGAGGAGGAAGTVTINTPNTLYTGAIFAYTGGAGAAGSAATGSAGGGGGGAGGSYGGGGGGGAAGSVGGVSATGGGGGGGIAGGGGGGSGAGATGGTGGSVAGASGATAGTGGGGTNPGGNGTITASDGTGGSGGPGGYATNDNTGGGGTFGYGGADGSSAGAGHYATAVGGLGTVSLTVGAATGTSKYPLEIDATQLNISEPVGTAKTASIYLSTSSDYLNLTGASMATGTTLSLIGNAGSGDIAVSGPVNATTVTLSSQNDLTTTGSGLITATTANLSSVGNLTATTAVANLGAKAQGSATITEVATSAGVVNVLASGAGTLANAGTFTLDSAESVNIKSAITLLGGSSLVLTTNGLYSNITSTPVLTATNLTINNSGNAGTAAKPLSTNVSGILTLNSTSSGGIYINDANKNTLEVTGSSTAPESTVSLTSAASTLNLASLPFSNVTIKDTSTLTTGGVNLAFGGSGVVGDGTGQVSITTVGASINTAATTSVVNAVSAVLTSTAGNVGTSSLPVNATYLTASAPKGIVQVADAATDVTLSAGTALSAYDVSANGLTVAGAVSGGTVNLNSNTGVLALDANVGSTKSTTVFLTSGNGIYQAPKVVVTGGTIDLTNNGGDIGTSTQSILTKATTTLTVNGSSVQSDYVSQTGSVALGASTAASGSELTLTDSGTLTIGSAVSFTSLNLTASNLTVATGATVSAAYLTVAAPVINFNGGTTTVSGTSLLQSAAGLAINGSGTVNLGTTVDLGGVVNGKATSSITLGDPKTGANNPLSSLSTVTNFNVMTTGNFTGAYPSFAVSSAGFGGAIDITAANIVNTGNTTGVTPIQFHAGTIVLNLTGTQNVTLDTASSAKAPAPYDLVLQGIGGGSISVTSKGLLTVNTLPASVGGPLSAITLSGAKGLSVGGAGGTALLNGAAASITLNSGSTANFVVGGATGSAAPINGVVGEISGLNVSITSAKTIEVAALTGGGASLNAGVLSLGAPVLTFDSNSTTSIASGANFYSPSTLTINGAGAINFSTGSFLNLGGVLGGKTTTAITLGDPKTGGNNPLATVLPSGTLGQVNVDTTGALTAVTVDSIVLNSAGNGGAISLIVSNIVNALSSTITAPLALKADGTTSAGSISLDITGTQNVSINTTSGYDLEANGPAGTGAILVTAKGLLQVDNFTSSSNSLATIFLNGGKGLFVSGTGTLDHTAQTIVLISGAATPFTIDSAVSNGTAGNVAANNVSVTDIKGITVNSSGSLTGSSTSGNSVTLDTSSLLNLGTISGGAGSNLSFFDYGKNNLGLSANSGGAYSGFSSVTFETAGNVSLGNLVTTAPTLDSVTINAGGSVTFSGTAPGISVSSGGSISVTAGSLVSTAAAPITFTLGTSAGGTGTIDVIDKAALTVGAAKGNIAINASASNSNVSLTSTSGALTISGAVSLDNLTLTGSSVAIKSAAAVTAAGNLTVLANGKTGTITTVTGSEFVDTAGTLTLGQGATALPKAPILVDATTIVAGATGGTGALNISNSLASAATLAGGTNVSALTYNGAGTVTVNSLTTSNGAISVTATKGVATAAGAYLRAVNGGITLAAGSGVSSALSIGANNTMVTTNGNITLQNLNTTNGTIDVGSGVYIDASGTAKGVGQVNIVIGAVPTKNLAIGTTPAPDAPTIHVNGGGVVYFGTTTSTNANTITANGANTLNAFGRNIVFNTGSLSASAITINGGTITADPPVVYSSNVSSSSSSSLSTASLVAAPVVVTPNASTFNPVSNSLYQPFALPFVSGSSPVGISDLAALSGLSALTKQNAQVQSAAEALQSSRSSSTVIESAMPSAGKRLTGGVSNVGVKMLDRGAQFVSPITDTIVRTPFGSVAIAAKSAALIMAFDGGIAVYNLHDNRKDSVVVNHSGQRMTIAPGQNIVFTDRHVRYFEEINPASKVAYRRMLSRDYGDGLKSFRSEFSILSLLQGYQPLQEIVSSQSAENRRLTQSMLKTAAILMNVGGSEQYEYMVAKPVTAYAAGVK